MNISDPNILLSYINTNLRDKYSSLDELLDNLDIDKEELINKLKEIGYFYDESINRFLKK